MSSVTELLEELATREPVEADLERAAGRRGYAVHRGAHVPDAAGTGRRETLGSWVGMAAKGQRCPGPGVVRRHRGQRGCGRLRAGRHSRSGLLLLDRSDTMAWVVGTGALLGLLAIASGIVTLQKGWIPPMARRHVTRPQLHGFGAVFTGTSVLLKGGGGFAAGTRVLRQVPSGLRGHDAVVRADATVRRASDCSLELDAADARPQHEESQGRWGLAARPQKQPTDVGGAQEPSGCRHERRVGRVRRRDLVHGPALPGNAWTRGL